MEDTKSTSRLRSLKTKQPTMRCHRRDSCSALETSKQQKARSSSDSQTSSMTQPRSTIGSRLGLLMVAMIVAAGEFTSSPGDTDGLDDSLRVGGKEPARVHATNWLLTQVSAHIVLTRDDRGQNLVVTGDEGGKGKGKGKGGGGDQLVIAGSQMGGGGGQDTNMIVQDAANREGDVVIQGNSMIVPGEDGHIVLADSRSKGGEGGGGHGGGRPAPFNPMLLWLPYMSSRSAYRMMPFFGMPYGR